MAAKGHHRAPETPYNSPGIASCQFARDDEMSICRSPVLHSEGSTLEQELTQWVHPEQAARVDQQAPDASLSLAVTDGPDNFDEYMDIDQQIDQQIYQALMEGTEPCDLPYTVEDLEYMVMQDLLYTTQLTDFD
jgi:hypothetical protein